MNTQLITEKIADVVKLLNIVNLEVEEIESKRIALENSSAVHTEREKRLNDISVAQAQMKKDLDAQKEYVDQQNKDQQLVLSKIALEKAGLVSLTEKRREIEKERLQLEIDKKELEGFQSEKQKLEADRAEFAKERALLAREKLAISEQQGLLVIREQNIKQKEERIDRIERMTQV